MKLVIIVLSFIIIASAQNTENPDPFVDEPPPSSVDVGTELITALLNSEFIQNKIHRIYQLIDLKIRLIKLVKSLITRDNLLVLRRILDYIVRVCNFVIELLPEPAPEFSKGVLEILFPTLTLQDPENPVNLQRFDRQVGNLTAEEQKQIVENQDDVIRVAKLIHNTP